MRRPRPSRSSAQTDRARCLRRFPYGESSLVAHFMTREHGRVALLAKGAFRPTSGHAGVIDLFDSIELSWKKPLHAELGVLTKARLVQRRRAIPADLERFREALAVLELCELEGVDTEVRPVHPDELGDAQEVFASSTAGGVMPVIQVDGRPIGNGHPGLVTTRLQESYWTRRESGWHTTAVADILAAQA